MDEDYEARRARRLARLAEIAELGDSSATGARSKETMLQSNRAPRPLEPLRQSADALPAAHMPRRIAPVVQTAPDWPFWLALRKVRIWQAAALSLGINPDPAQMKQADNGYMAGPPLIFKPESFVDQEQAAQFNKRRRIIASHLVDDETADVEFATWPQVADMVHRFGWEVPDALSSAGPCTSTSTGGPTQAAQTECDPPETAAAQGNDSKKKVGAQAVAAPDAELAGARRARRLAKLRELGGDMRQAGSGWQMIGRRGALAALVREEVAAGRPVSARQDVTRDLIAAMAVQAQG